MSILCRQAGNKLALLGLPETGAVAGRGDEKPAIRAELRMPKASLLRQLTTLAPRFHCPGPDGRAVHGEPEGTVCRAKSILKPGTRGAKQPTTQNGIPESCRAVPRPRFSQIFSFILARTDLYLGSAAIAGESIGA
jgi:hypothetical protein